MTRSSHQDDDFIEVGERRQRMVAVDPRRRCRSRSLTVAIDEEVARRLLIVAQCGTCVRCEAAGELIAFSSRAPLCWDCFLFSRGMERRLGTDYHEETWGLSRKHDHRTPMQRRMDRCWVTAMKQRPLVKGQRKSGWRLRTS